MGHHFIWQEVQADFFVSKGLIISWNHTAHFWIHNVARVTELGFIHVYFSSPKIATIFLKFYPYFPKIIMEKLPCPETYFILNNRIMYVLQKTCKSIITLRATGFKPLIKILYFFIWRSSVSGNFLLHLTLIPVGYHQQSTLDNKSLSIWKNVQTDIHQAVNSHFSSLWPAPKYPLKNRPGTALSKYIHVLHMYV